MSDAHDPREPQSLPSDPAGASAPRPQRGTSNTFAGTIFLGVVVLLCVAGWWFSWRPRHPSSVSTASSSPAESPTVSGGGALSVPRGWVKIVNQQTGGVLFGDIAAWKIEPVGDGYRLKNRKAGQYAALAEWAKRTDDAKRKGGRAAGLLHLVSDPAAAATWNVRALPGGLYLIQERQTGKCLESRVSGDTHVARLAPLKSDDPRQQWRFEPSPAADSTNATNDGALSRPMPQTATSPEPPRTNATASKASDSSRKEALTAAQKEQIRLRLQALYAALYSLPRSGPADQLANVMQQEANLRSEIAELEAQLGDTAEPKGK